MKLAVSFAVAQDRLRAHDAVMQLMIDILSDTRRYRDEAIKTLSDVKGGGLLAEGMTREDAIQILTANIETYEGVLRRHGWTNDA